MRNKTVRSTFTNSQRQKSFKTIVFVLVGSKFRRGIRNKPVRCDLILCSYRPDFTNARCQCPDEKKLEIPSDFRRKRQGLERFNSVSLYTTPSIPINIDTLSQSFINGYQRIIAAGGIVMMLYEYRSFKKPKKSLRTHSSKVYRLLFV